MKVSYSDLKNKEDRHELGLRDNNDNKYIVNDLENEDAKSNKTHDEHEEEHLDNIMLL